MRGTRQARVDEMEQDGTSDEGARWRWVDKMVQDGTRQHKTAQGGSVLCTL